MRRNNIMIWEKLNRFENISKFKSLSEAARNGKFSQSTWSRDIKKLEESGNKNILLTERGASFGYNTLVSDMRALPIMAKFGYPIVFDATHSVQQPGGLGETSGGQREFVPFLARSIIVLSVYGCSQGSGPNLD